MTAQELCQLLQRPQHTLPGAEIDQRVGATVQQVASQVRKNRCRQGARWVARGDQAGSLAHHLPEAEQPGMLDLPDVCRFAVEQQYGERRIGPVLVQGRGEHPCPRELTTAHDRARIHDRHSMDTSRRAGEFGEQTRGQPRKGAC